MYRPPKTERNLLTAAIQGPNENGEFFRAFIKDVKLRERDGQAQIERTTPVMAPEALVGCWLCVPKSRLLEDSTSVYCFQLLGCRIQESPESEAIARVDDYFETGAHGVLGTVMEDGREVLLPFLESFVELRLEEGIIIVPRYRDFIV